MSDDGAAAERHRRRRAAVMEAAGSGGVAAMLVSGRADVRYLSGFTGSNGWLLLQRDTAVLVTDPRYRAQAAGEAVGCEVHVVGDGLVEGFAGLGPSVGTLGYQASQLTVAELADLREALPEHGWEDRAAALTRVRRHKDPEEVAAVRRALALAEEVLGQMAPRIGPGMTEAEVAALLEYRCRCRGAEGMSFETIVAAGDHAALPHARPRRRTLEPGDVLLVDLGCVVDGYCSDITRMIALGEPGPDWLGWHAAVDAAVEAALAAARPGVRCCEVDAAARRSLEADGLADAFAHGLGHGVGLEVHEAPRLSSRSDDVLEEGMLFTLEPGVYLAGRGGVRLEDMVFLDAEGPQRLNELGRGILQGGARAS